MTAPSLAVARREVERREPDIVLGAVRVLEDEPLEILHVPEDGGRMHALPAQLLGRLAIGPPGVPVHKVLGNG
eukprot:CAMPEP_0174948522 /NCGR_PEP_ID=MMETSP1355-20121228/89252_1 /TAXON_ID=464990 /ORGANISM="Hemiselmis tepida, Strain CCMP443" /LENGTH=72 /DNA_ID=CAMNT_0016196039 /DNA_START=86 /DNA_END=301 /DNA_ORIENTATION=-